MKVLPELIAQRMCALTKAALHGTMPDENLFFHTTENDWNDLFEQSAIQGVMVLTLNGAMKLPKVRQPPLPVKLRWIASVEKVEKRYRRQLETARQLDAFFRANNIRMLLFKGVSLARLYPEPYSREFGDIDIFLCGKSKEGDVLLKRIAGNNMILSKKHSCWLFRGISVENHHTFLNHSSFLNFYNSRVLEKRLMTILTEAGVIEEMNLSEPDKTDESRLADKILLPDEALLSPPPEFDALFVLLHILSHVPAKIALRHLCDLTVLFTAYKGAIDFSAYRTILSEAGLLKTADVLFSLSVKYLGLNPAFIPPYESDLALEKRIWIDLLNPVFPPPEGKRTIGSVIRYKIRLLRLNRWKYDLVFPGKYWKRILYSTFSHLIHPASIRRLT